MIKCSRILFGKLSGGVIYLALFVSFILSILLGSLILMVHYTSRGIDDQLERDQILSDINSGFILALSDTLIFNNIGTTQVSLYEDSDDSSKVSISNKPWGVYRIICCSPLKRNTGNSSYMLAGTDPEDGDKLALYLSDRENFLSIAGSTKLIGDCSLPKLGLRAAFIEGQSFTSDKLVDGKIDISTRYLPKINRITADSIEFYLDLKISHADSLADPNSIETSDFVTQSFARRTLTYFSNEPIILDNTGIQGNVRIISGSSIIVKAGFKCNDIILYAPKIYFSNEFKGSCQAFAKDTIIIGKDCIFRYPSVIGLFNTEDNQTFLQINPGSSFSGSIFLKSDLRSRNKSVLQIPKGVLINGEIYWPGTVRFQGIIYGSMYCNAFELNTFNGTYNDFLLNATIDRKSLSKYISFSCINRMFNKGKDIKWLE